MKIPKDEFLALQRLWYDKLKEAGFKDIETLENGELSLKDQYDQRCVLYTSKVSAFERHMQEEYYRVMAQIAQDEETAFKNEVHRFILIRHTEGARVSVIRQELLSQGFSRNRDSIRFIIRRYEMAWGIRRYNRRELNLKRKA